MFRYRETILVAFCCSLLACDIQSVSVGEWNITLEGRGAIQESVWTINETSLLMTGDMALMVEELELSGSRISWSSSMANPDSGAGENTRVNFNGTVDGDQMAGTLFTQFGNYTVTGSRR
ncbi:MAG: hypothetical protein MI746_09005 [Pseudomonadales bacterium]|nr:hypothetical protein [Pseudomonadales bacterium]